MVSKIKVFFHWSENNKSSITLPCNKKLQNYMDDHFRVDLRSFNHGLLIEQAEWPYDKLQFTKIESWGGVGPSIDKYEWIKID